MNAEVGTLLFLLTGLWDRGYTGYRKQLYDQAAGMTNFQTVAGHVRWIARAVLPTARLSASRRETILLLCRSK